MPFEGILRCFHIGRNLDRQLASANEASHSWREKWQQQQLWRCQQATCEAVFRPPQSTGHSNKKESKAKAFPPASRNGDARAQQAADA